MKERPILFSSPMVRAILANLKRMTRRAVKWRKVASGLNQSFSGLRAVEMPAGWVLESDTRTSSEWRYEPTPCPYGKAGDRLWVRETFCAFGRWETRFSQAKGRDEWHFVDMTKDCGLKYGFVEEMRFAQMRRLAPRGGASPTWWKRPAIFMPRAASRILLEIVSVRVERLQAIAEADAIAEGIERAEDGWHNYGYPAAPCVRARTSFATLWAFINGTGSWDANPWV